MDFNKQWAIWMPFTVQLMKIFNTFRKFNYLQISVEKFPQLQPFGWYQVTLLGDRDTGICVNNLTNIV